MSQNKLQIINEYDYLLKGADKLKNVVCPTCNCNNCLFMGVVFIGCRECGNFFDTKDFEK